MVGFLCTQPNKAMQLTEERLPAHWASVLINEDWSGLDEQECELIQSFISNELYGLLCVDVADDASFQLAPSYYPWLQAGDYATFTFKDFNE